MPTPLLLLNGETIVRWVGTEEALTGGNAIVTDDTTRDGWARDSPYVWEHPDVPFRQFAYLDVELASGRGYRLFSELDAEVGSGVGGLYLSEIEQLAKPLRSDAGIGRRTRTLDAMPTGVALVKRLRETRSAGVLEALLTIDGAMVRLLAAEIYPLTNGSFEVVEHGGAILVQVDGHQAF